MSVQHRSEKCVVSVLEMAEMLGLSKSRLYDLMQAGIFPRPVQHASCKRPVFDQESQQKCLEIRRTGVGHNGQPVLFNRKRRAKVIKRRQDKRQPVEDHGELIEALNSLGMTTNKEAVQNALSEVCPDGWKKIDQGELVRRVFLHLQKRA